VVLCAGISNAFAETQKQQAEEAVIWALDEKWSATALKNDVDGAVAFYAEDAVLLAPNVPIAAGKKSIRESWAGLLGPNTAVSWKVTEVEVPKPRDLGYLYGTYQLSMPDPKGRPAISDAGKVLEVWKKQTDSQWKCIVDTYNSDLPTAAGK